MVRGIPSILIPNAAYTTVDNGKMSLPVEASSLIYSHFEHVSGIPVQNGGEGVAISKLNLLDVLIEQIKGIKKNSPLQIDADPRGGVDSLIENMRKQILQAKASSEAMPYIHSPRMENGSLFNIIS